MAKSKKSKTKTAAPQATAKSPAEEPYDPHAVLRHAADPPRPNLIAFLIALGVFFAWFVYLVYVAVWG